jgi:hypothetical protein
MGTNRQTASKAQFDADAAFLSGAIEKARAAKQPKKAEDKTEKPSLAQLLTEATDSGQGF